MSMKLYLVQHGEAKPEAEDPERRGKGSCVSVQRHCMFGKERVWKMGSGPDYQTGNGLRERRICN